jgi:ABC-type uncharacterized transport system substrate-binding protein
MSAYAVSTTTEIVIVGVDQVGTTKAAKSLFDGLARDKDVDTSRLAIYTTIVDLAVPAGPWLDVIKNHPTAIFYVVTPLLVPVVRRAALNAPIVVSGVIDMRNPSQESPPFSKDKLVTGYLFQQTPMAKRVSHLSRLCSGIVRLGYLTTREARKMPDFDRFIERERASLHKLGITLEVIHIDSVEEVKIMPALVKTFGLNAFDIVYTQFVADHFDEVLAGVQRAAVPYVFSLPQAVTRGAAFSVYTAMEAKDAKIAAIVAALIRGEPVHSFPIEIQTSQSLAVRYSEFSKIKSCDADRAIRLATIRIQ